MGSMSHQWSPEQTIEPPYALRLIQSQFPELKAQKILVLGAGWDNTAFLIDDQYIFRFPRRKISVPLLEAEWCLLPKLAGRLPVPIPLPKWRGNPEGSYPWPFVGYRMLSGFTACYANLSDEQRCSLAKPIAHFLKVLHATPKELVSGCHIEGDNKARINADVMRPKIEKNLEELKLLGLMDRVNPIEGTFRPPRADTIVHGDFYVRHMLVDEKHQLCGVIDWGDIHLGDQAIDLSIGNSFFPKKGQDLFRDAYGGIDDATWELAKLRSIYSATMLVLYGYHSDAPNLVREGLRVLKSI